MENIKTIGKTIYQMELENIENAISVFDSDSYESIVKEVLETTKNWWRIIMTWVGKNSFLAAKTAATMSSIWIPAFYLDTTWALHWDLWMITKKDFVIHLSKSWNTDEMINAAYNMKKLWYKQWAIICNEKWKVKDIVNITLVVPFIKEADFNWLAPSSSSTLLLMICDTIWLTVSKLIWFKKDDFFKFHPWGSLWKMLKEELWKEI